MLWYHLLEPAVSAEPLLLTGTPANAGARSPGARNTHNELDNRMRWIFSLHNRRSFSGFFLPFIMQIHGPEPVPRHHTIAARSSFSATPSDMHDDHAVAVTTYPTHAATSWTGHISARDRGSTR